MSGLNSSQRIAVNHVSGPLLVLAGAGTGKTRVITYRMANLIRKGVPPARILGVTFTNKAANEMQERLAAILRKRSKERPLISTFHSYCVRVLRRHITRLGYPQRFAIYSASDQESLARTVLREIKVSDTVLSPTELIFSVGKFKNAGWSSEEAKAAAQSDADHVAAVAYRRYQSHLKRLGAVDFDDLLLLSVKLFREHPEVRSEEADRFDQILIDEYQDTNHTQYEIVRSLARNHRNLCVVGDDDQSIYGWRGAEVEHILNFKQDWNDAVVVRLVDNYRSTEAILSIANRLIAHNKLRHGKVLRADRPGGTVPTFTQFPDEAKEAGGVVSAIEGKLRDQHRQPRDFAILFRTNEQTRSFETELRKAKVPYVLIGGQSFFDRKEVQDVASYLRILGGTPDDTAVLRILNRPARGVGRKAVECLVQESTRSGKSVWEVIDDENGSFVASVPSPAQRGLRRLREAVQHAQHDAAAKGLVGAVTGFLEDIDYRSEISRLASSSEEEEMRWNAVQQVINALGEYCADAKSPDLSEFLDQLLLGDRDVDDEKDKQLRKNAVFLMTIHAAKGLEFPEVYLVGLEEGIMPHHRSVGPYGDSDDEERRLCYVAVTRARELLHMSMCSSRMKWGKARPRLPSRFVYEMYGKTEHPNYQRACQSAGIEVDSKVSESEGQPTTRK